MSGMELLAAIRCPTDGQRLFDTTLSGRGAVVHKCPRCGQLWRYDLARRTFTLAPRDQATTTCRSEMALVAVA